MGEPSQDTPQLSDASQGMEATTDSQQGMGPFATGCLQIGTGCGVTLLGAPLNAASFGLCGCLLQPAVVAYAETWAGDYFGQKRGSAIYPMVATYAFGIAATAASFALPNVFPVAPLASMDPGQALIELYSQPNPWITTGASVALSAIGMVLIPVVYNLTAEDKLPGDTGAGLPGIMEPAHPQVAATTSLPPAAPTEMAMAW